MWNKKSIFIFDAYNCISEGQHVSNKKAFLLEFCSLAAVNEFFVKFFKNKSKTTLRYDTWCIKTGSLVVDIQIESISANSKKSSNIGKHSQIFVKLSKPPLFLSCFTRICVFSSFLSKSKNPLLERCHYRYGYITQCFN